MTRALCISMALGVLWISSSAAAYTVNSSAPSDVYDADTAAMDQALGVSGFIVEDFEDATLDPALEITPLGLSWSPSTPNTLRNWDGVALANFSANHGGTLTIEIPGGASSVGLGVGGASLAGHTISINGGTPIDYTALSGYESSASARNVFLLIHPDADEAPITSVTLTMADPGELISIDHLVFNPSPDLGEIIDGLRLRPPAFGGEVIDLSRGGDIVGFTFIGRRIRLRVFTLRLIAAQALLGTELQDACDQLDAALNRLTGPRPWFNEPLASELADDLTAVQSKWGCF